VWITQRAAKQYPRVIFASPVGQPQGPALGEELRTGRPVNGAVHAATAQQRRVRGVHNRIHFLGGDVALGDHQSWVLWVLSVHRPRNRL